MFRNTNEALTKGNGIRGIHSTKLQSNANCTDALTATLALDFAHTFNLALGPSPPPPPTLALAR